MSFFRKFFESKPAQTDQEYTVSLVDQLLDGKANSFTISNLKEFSVNYSEEISSRGIPALVKSLVTFSENEEVINDIIGICANLLRTENNQKDENAKIFLQCDDTIPNFIRNLDNKNPEIRVGSMHILMMLANLQSNLFIDALTAHQPQMIRLFGSISDTNKNVSSRFVSVIPKLVENNHDFQQIVAFYSFDALVNSISRDNPEFLEALISVLKDNQINQLLFVNSGYLKIIENMIKTPDENILNLLLILFDPSNESNYQSFQNNLESTNIINVLCDNVIRNVYRPLNLHLLSLCIKGNKNLTEKTKEKISNFVSLALETRKGTGVNNNSFLDGIDIFSEFFESFIFNSEENSHFLNSVIINSQNMGVDGTTESFLNLCTFSILISFNCRSDFETVFTSLIANIQRYQSFDSMFKFFVCFCWESKEYCDMITEEKLTNLVRLLIEDNSNGYFVPNGNLNEKRNHYLHLLFAEIILFSGKNHAKIGTFVKSTVLPFELEKILNQENENLNDNSKFGQFEKQIIAYINEHHLANSLNPGKGDEDVDDYNQLQELNNELKNKLAETEVSLNKEKSENEGKNSKIESLLASLEQQKSTIDSLTNENKEIKELNEKLNEKLEELQKQNSNVLAEAPNIQSRDISNKFHSDDFQEEEEEDSVNSNKVEEEEIREKSINLNQDIQEEEEEENSSKFEEEEEDSSKLNEEEEEDSSKLNKIESAKMEIESLKKQLLEKEATEKTEIEKLINEIAELKSQLESRNEKLQSEETSKLHLQEKIDDLTSQLTQSNSDNEQLRTKVEKKSIETTELIKKFNKEISELRSQQNLSGNEMISTLNSQIEELKNSSNNQKQEFENEKEILRQNISKLQLENNKLEDDCNSLMDVKAKLQEEEKKHENEETLLTSKNDELQKQLKEIESLNAQNMEALKLSFDTEKQKMLIEIESLNNQIEKYKQSDQMTSDEAKSLRNQLNELQSTSVPINEVELIRKENIDLTKKCSQLNSKINELESKKNNEELNEENNVDHLLRIKVDELENQLAKANEDSRGKDEQIDLLSNEVKEAKKQLSLNDNLANEMRKTNEKLLDQISQMKEKIENFKKQQNHIITKGNVNLRNKTEEEEEEGADKRIEQLNDKVSKLENENKMLKTKLLSKLQKDSDNFFEKEETSDLFIESLSKEIEQLSNNKENNLDQEEERNQGNEEENANENDQNNIEKEEEEQENVDENDLEIEIENQVNEEDEDESLNDKELIQKLEKLNNEVNNLQTENQNLREQNQLNDINQQAFKQQELQINELRTTISKLQEENKELQNKLNSSQNDPSSEENSSSKSKHEIVIESQRKLINKLRAQNQKLEEDSIKENVSSEKLILQNDQLQSELKRAKQEAAARIQELKMKLSNLIKENNALQEKVKVFDMDESDESGKKKVVIDKDYRNNSLRNQLQEMQTQITMLKSENQQLKLNPTKLLLSSLKEENANLKEKIRKLEEENINEFESDEIVNPEDFKLSPINRKSIKKPNKMSHQLRKNKFNRHDDRDDLLTEIEILKQDNENQSHAITDLQMMLGAQSYIFDPNGSANASNPYLYSSFQNDLKNLSVENEILNSKLNEMKLIESENKKLQMENMELKRMIRNKVDSPNDVSKDKDSQSLSDESKQKKALRLIGKLWLDQSNSKLNM